MVVLRCGVECDDDVQCMYIYICSEKIKDLETRLENEISMKQEKEKLLSQQIENLEKIKEKNEQLQSEIIETK